MFRRPAGPLQDFAVGFHELFERNGAVRGRSGRELYRIYTHVCRAVLLVQPVGGSPGAEDALHTRRLHELAYFVRNGILYARIAGPHDGAAFQYVPEGDMMLFEQVPSRNGSADARNRTRLRATWATGWNRAAAHGNHGRKQRGIRAKHACGNFSRRSLKLFRRPVNLCFIFGPCRRF